MNVLRFGSAADVAAVAPRVEDHLARGGLIAYPTETVYGLGSRVQEDDLFMLASVTKRPSGKPFLVLVANTEMATQYKLRFTSAANRLASRFWPGPLTLVLAGGEGLFPDEIRGEQGGVAVRWSSHAETTLLIERLGVPISSTSANISGEQPLPDVVSILSVFSGAVDSGKLLVLDGGALGSSPSSTLVDCTSPTPRLLREGAIASREVMECLEEVGGGCMC